MAAPAVLKVYTVSSGSTITPALSDLRALQNLLRMESGNSLASHLAEACRAYLQDITRNASQDRTGDEDRERALDGTAWLAAAGMVMNMIWRIGDDSQCTGVQRTSHVTE